MIHVHCGDSSAEQLRLADVPGDVIVWTELLFAGPNRMGATRGERLRERAEFLSLATGGFRSPTQTADFLSHQDSNLERCLNDEETVLWFDACLFDQSILIYLLDWFHQRGVTGDRLKLICAGDFPGKSRFLGLGELSPLELASLFPGRQAVSEAQFSQACQAWRAVTGPDPTEIRCLASDNCAALPYVCAALWRFLEQFPSTLNGLNRLQQECLETLADGVTSPTKLFKAVSDREERPFFGDTFLWQTLNALAEAAIPAIAMRGPGPLPLWNPTDLERWRLELSATGQDLLAGRADWIGLNGIDAWYGGTHLQTPNQIWRWDTRARVLVRGT